MSWSELDIPTDDELWLEELEMHKPIHDFGGLKNLLSRMGYKVNKAEGYKPIDVAEVTLEEINSGAIEFTEEGIFVTSEGVRRQVFLYKRDYHLEAYGKPRFHIRKCQVIESFTNGQGRVEHYRRANTDKVWVHDIDDGMIDKEVTALPLCKYCLKMALEAQNGMTTTDFVELLRNADEAEPETDVEIDLFGYTRDWEQISTAYRSTHNYTCEVCGLHITDPFDQHYIHVHHKNGRKIDNRTSNLQCLCLRCHSEVDAHHRERLLGTKAQRLMFSDFEKKYPRIHCSNITDDVLPF